MEIKLTKYEQICVTVAVGDGYYVFDPGSEASIDSILASGKPNAAFVSHSHPDHYNAENLRKLGCPVYGTQEVVDDMLSSGINVTHLAPMNSVDFGELSVTPFSVDHGPISAPIENLAFHVKSESCSVLFLGDIKFASDLPEAVFDAVLIPVGGSKVFDVDEAIAFARSSNFRGLVIPAHYHGRADRGAGELFATRGTGLDVRVLDVGESVVLGDR